MKGQTYKHNDQVVVLKSQILFWLWLNVWNWCLLTKSLFLHCLVVGRTVKQSNNRIVSHELLEREREREKVENYWIWEVIFCGEVSMINQLLDLHQQGQKTKQNTRWDISHALIISILHTRILVYVTGNWKKLVVVVSVSVLGIVPIIIGFGVIFVLLLGATKLLLCLTRASKVDPGSNNEERVVMFPTCWRFSWVLIVVILKLLRGVGLDGCATGRLSGT